MNNKNTSMIATIIAAVLCGCPGLLGLCWGLVSVFAGFMPGSEIDFNGNSDPAAAITAGLVALCLSIIFIAIPVVVWFVTRPKKLSEADAPSFNEPMPPAS
ncbi:MAG: hypothetical protein EHM40_17725 [Chloroflexi bacterium]|nr:MAG: hypothetical protein EHM40_17725 [Chloroflexota bacterium]